MIDEMLEKHGWNRKDLVRYAIGILLVIMGLFVNFSSLAKVEEDKKMVQHGFQAEGVITDKYYQIKGEPRSGNAEQRDARANIETLLVTYTLPGGGEYKMESVKERSPRSESQFSVNDVVTVYYDPENPSDVILEDRGKGAERPDDIKKASMLITVGTLIIGFQMWIHHLIRRHRAKTMKPNGNLGATQNGE